MIDISRLVGVCGAIANRAGVFVEAGANDGVRQSNTLRLEQQFGWNGVLIEPSPHAFEQLEVNRPGVPAINAALVGSDYSLPTVQGAFLDGQLTGTVVRSLMKRSPDLAHSRGEVLARRIRKAAGFSAKASLVEVPAKTLTECLDMVQIRCIDLLSLDVEGYEYEALQGLDLARFRPKLILIEVRDSAAWNLIQWFYKNGYVVVEKLSDFAESQNLQWTGDHEDYLVADKQVLASNSELRLVLGIN